MANDLRPEQTSPATPAAAAPASASSAAALGNATYDVIRQRLQTQGALLRERMSQLDARRQAVFGAIEFKLLQADRITTAHNCVPRDMVQLDGGRFLFGFNVHFGLKKEIELADVFAIFKRDAEARTFKEETLAPLEDKQFLVDFKRLYNVYSRASFDRFSLIENNLYMVFQVGVNVTDIAVFKWVFESGRLQFADGRSEGEFRRVGFPPQYDFSWCTPDRESFRYGDHPHVSIEDRVFVECVGGDLTIKVEDNTASGEGIYAEPVEDKYQKVDDAEFAYASLAHLILLKVRPYKETNPRYFIFNEKQQTAARVDSIGQSCVRLPEDHGLIFPDGYYLMTGELKLFESKEQGMTFDKVIHAPNGEDSLFVFYHRAAGVCVLMPYTLIEQRVKERIVCHGFSLFPDGHLLTFRGDPEPQKHHTIQLRQTPFHQKGYEPPGQRDAFLYQVGNKEVVRCLAECNEVLTLIRKDNPYAALYADLVKRCGAMLDAYPWLSSPDGFQLDAALRQIQAAADQAVDEFEKVRRLQREAVQRMTEMQRRSQECFQSIRRASFRSLTDYVSQLSALRALRGELVTLKDVRYVEVASVEQLEKSVVAQTEELSQACIRFLQQPAALEPYRKQAAELLAAVGQVGKVAEGKKLEAAIAQLSTDLEMLIEIINNLRIDDATEATRIIDSISAIYATLNQVKAALKNRLQTLVATESAAQFAAQTRLLSQSAASYLDLCDSPEKCDEYLNRLTVQLEELEGAFAGFEEYTVQLAERRTELYAAFEQRKIALVEQRQRRASALLTAAERILKVIQNRLGGFASIEEINAYVASDLMVAKVREIVDQLLALGDSVKADDLQGRLKSAQQDAVRQLKDRQELFSSGEGLIQLGKHRFNVNTQPLDLTVVNREGVQFIHLTSTKYFDEITAPEFLTTRDVWDQEVVSENASVYRGEYLASRLLMAMEHTATPGQGRGAPPEQGPTGSTARLLEFLQLSDSERLARVQEFMSARYQEGYTKGVHDWDGLQIFSALLSTHLSLQLARYRPEVRACALVFWNQFCPPPTRELWTAKLKGFSERNRLFPGDPMQESYMAGLRGLLATFIQETQLYDPELAAPAAAYLFDELISSDSFVLSQEADQLLHSFHNHLVQKGSEGVFRQARQALVGHPASELELLRDWVRGFLLGGNGAQTYTEEVAAWLFCGERVRRSVVQAGTSQTLRDLKGSHPLLRQGEYQFDYLAFQEKLRRFARDVVPRFERFHQLKQELLEAERKRLRLDEFKPRVLTTFVRNQLIDRVYLPLVGDNLAKQIGAAGDQKRTDRMGLLLLISPPGYGKTTLLEYIASRLGLVFVKINGPALGHNVSSLDPEEAPNAAAREEIQRLNLAFEMGDNTMLCVDDIQHCSPEFLQKFISLCDAQRKVEGVWRGRSRTYDLRGRKFAVVMAGNPYTESGQKFKLPDMLANRADTYNLGDIIGGSVEWFKASYLENAVTSNPVLAPLANKSQADIRACIRMAESNDRDPTTLEGSYSSRELDEILAVMKKLVAVREVVLRVNQEYIHSAAQADEFRTEPPFRLQGSYRNMNRLAEKVVAIMNDQETLALVVDHYKSESQTLATGAEANFLKFKELLGTATPAESARWEEIKQTFKRHQLAGAGGTDPVGRVVSQLAAFHSGLESIQSTLHTQLSRTTAPVAIDLGPVGQRLEELRATIAEKWAAPAAVPVPVPAAQPEAEPLARQLVDGLQAFRADLTSAITAVHSGAMTEKVESLSHELEMIHSTLATLKDLAAQQRNHLRDAQELLATRARQGTVEIDLTQEMLTNERAFLEKIQEVLTKPRPESQEPPGNPSASPGAS